MPADDVECRDCGRRVRLRRDERDGPLDCPDCGARLLDGLGESVQTRPGRDRDEVRRSDRRDDRGDDRRDGRRDDRRRPRERRESSSSSLPWVIGGGVLFAVLLLCGGVGSALFFFRQASVEREVGKNNLKQIGLAMHAYHDSSGALPGDLVGRDGKPLLSWRVALLPYVEQDNLYRQFRLDEPWDSAHNIQLARVTPRVYVVPGREKEAAQGLTFYQGFAGPGTLFDPALGNRRPRLAGIADGTSNTIFVVEAGDAVPWTKPADLPFVPNGPLPKLGGHRSGDFYALMGDGSVRTMRDKSPEHVVKALATYAGGEVVADF